MAQKAKITRVGKVTFDELALRKKFSGKVRDVLEKKAEASAKAEITRAIKSYIKADIQSVHDNLARGFSSPAAKGSKTARFRLPNGETGQYRTTAWKPLTPAYRRRWPPSRVFWRKHFVPLVEPDYEPLLYSFRSLLSSSSVSARSTTSKVVISRNNAYNLSWDMLFETDLPEVLKVRILGSLLSGTPQGVGMIFPGVSRNSVTRIAYVEGRRPFISGMSAAMGRRMRQNIAKEFVVNFLRKRT